MPRTLGSVTPSPGRQLRHIDIIQIIIFVDPVPKVFLIGVEGISNSSA